MSAFLQVVDQKYDTQMHFDEVKLSSTDDLYDNDDAEMLRREMGDYSGKLGRKW